MICARQGRHDGHHKCPAASPAWTSGRFGAVASGHGAGEGRRHTGAPPPTRHTRPLRDGRASNGRQDYCPDSHPPKAGISLMKRTLSLPILGALVCAAILGATLLFGATGGAAGPNLLTNGDFSQGSVGWAPASQAGLNPTPNGSLLVENNVAGINGSNDGAVQ